MKILYKYIAYHVVFAILATLFVATSLYTVFALIDELDGFRGNYGIWEAFNYILLTTPRRIYEIFPASVMLGSLVGLGMLAGTSELTAIRASGCSINRIVVAVFMPVFALCVINALIGEFVAVELEEKAQIQKISQKYSKNDVQSYLEEGNWYREDKDFIHINQINLSGDIFGLTKYTKIDDNLTNVLFAEKATFNKENKTWDLQNVRTTNLSDLNVLKITNTQNDFWSTTLTPELVSINMLNPNRLPIMLIYKYIDYLKNQSLNSASYEVAWWKKILQPIVILSLVLFAISFVFGSMRSVTLGQRLFTGILIGFSFKVIQDFVENFSIIAGILPFLAIMLPAVVCIILGIYGIKRTT